MYNKWTNYSAGNYELCTDNFDELHIWGGLSCMAAG
jgi:hypothetical protein